MVKVKWTLPRKLLEETFLSKNKFSKNGLFLEPVEFAGVLEFKENNCRIIDSVKVCDKKYDSHSIVKGYNSSVNTPFGTVNFHTHPLKCYIDGNVIWGWPSGEDLAQCMHIAKKGNLYHIIFTIEGTYVIKVNNKILDSLTPQIIDCIETIFKMTHKYRWYKNLDSSNCIIDEFKQFISLIGNLPSAKNTLDMWLKYVNNFKLKDCTKYTNIVVPKNRENEKIFNVQFFPNNTVQYIKNYNETNSLDIFTKLKNIKNQQDAKKIIYFPENITFY